MCIKGRTQTCATCAAAGRAKRNGNKNANTHTDKQSNICMRVCGVCVLAPSRISFARERDEAEKIKRIKYKNGNNKNNNKAETETEAGRAKYNGAPACPLAEADRQRDMRTDGQTYLRSNVNPFAATLSPLPLLLPLLAHTHFYMGAARTPM